MQIQVEEKEDDTEESSSKWGRTYPHLGYVSCGIVVNSGDSSSYLVGICYHMQVEEHVWMTFDGLTKEIKTIKQNLYSRFHSIGTHTFHPIYNLLMSK